MPNKADIQPMTVPAIPVPGPGVAAPPLAFKLSPICRPCGPGEAADDDALGAGAQQVGGHAAEPGTDQACRRPGAVSFPVHRPGLLVRTQELKPVKIMVGSEAPRARWVMILPAPRPVRENSGPARDDDEAAADTEQPGQHAREGAQHQIAHKQHKHSFNNETAVNLTAIIHKKKRWHLAISLLCRLMQGNGTVHHLVERQHGATEQGCRHPLLQPVEGCAGRGAGAPSSR